MWPSTLAGSEDRPIRSVPPVFGAAAGLGGGRCRGRRGSRRGGGCRRARWRRVGWCGSARGRWRCRGWSSTRDHDGRARCGAQQPEGRAPRHFAVHVCNHSPVSYSGSDMSADSTQTWHRPQRKGAAKSSGALSRGGFLRVAPLAALPPVDDQLRALVDGHIDHATAREGHCRGAAGDPLGEGCADVTVVGDLLVGRRERRIARGDPRWQRTHRALEARIAGSIGHSLTGPPRRTSRGRAPSGWPMPNGSLTAASVSTITRPRLKLSASNSSVATIASDRHKRASSIAAHTTRGLALTISRTFQMPRGVPRSGTISSEPGSRPVSRSRSERMASSSAISSAVSGSGSTMPCSSGRTAARTWA